MILIYSLILILISIFTICYTRIMFSVFRGHGNVLFQFVEYLIYYKIFFYMLLPAILRGVSGFKVDLAVNVGLVEIAVVYFMEALSYIIWIGVFVFFIRKSKSIKKSRYWIDIAEKFMLVTLFFYLLFSLDDFIAVFNVHNYINLDLPVISMFKPLVLALGPVLACFCLAYFKWENKNNSYFLLSFIAFFVFIIMSVISGVRGLIIHSLFFMIFIFFIFNKKKLVINVGLILLFFALFQSYYMSIRHLDSEDKVSMLSSGNIGEQKRSLVDEAEFRYGEQSRLSVAFLRRGMNSDFAGMTPLESSMYAPLPRSYFPDKPIPGSIGIDKYSMGMYLINSDIRGEWWNMTEFFPSAHSYWEFGTFGVLLVPIISAFYIYILAMFLVRLNFLAIPFLLLFFKPWGYNEVKIWLYEIPLQIFQYIIPSLVIVFFIILSMEMRKYFWFGKSK